MRIHVSYKKPQVVQALRYHFISRRELKLMIILVNVFSLMSAALFFLKLIGPLPFLMSSVLWMAMMASFWFWLPGTVYRRSKTFQDNFDVSLEENHMFIETERGSRTWAWREFKSFFETPNFFHLYFDSRTFFLVPKDAFPNSDEVHNARVLLKEKIGKK